jgi:hypothetical protein
MRISPMRRGSPDCCSCMAFSTSRGVTSPRLIRMSPRDGRRELLPEATGSAVVSSPAIASLDLASPTVVSASADGFVADRLRACSFVAVSLTAVSRAAAAFAFLPRAGAAPFTWSKRVNRAINSWSLRSPSLPVASMLDRICRTASTMASRAVVSSGCSLSCPSRSFASRFSPTCATASSWPQARNPEVPLMV